MLITEGNDLNRDDAVLHYVARRGVACPRCNDEQIEGTGDSEFEAGTIRQHMHCTSCNAAWWDVYTLTGIQIDA